MDENNPLKILLVEDSESDARLFQEHIVSSGITDLRIDIASSLYQALDYLKSNHADAMLLDLSLPDSNGLGTIKEVKRAFADMPIVVLTGVDDERIGIEAVRMGVQDYLVKGRSDGRLIVRAIRYAVERKQIEQTLHESENRLTHALEAGELGSWGLDIKTERVWRSLRYDSIFGYQALAPEWTYQIFLNHVLPDDRKMVDEKFAYAISTGTELNFECRIRRTDGATRWIWSQSRPRLNEQNKVVQLVGLVKDITNEKQIRGALEIEQNRLQTIMQNMPAAVIMAEAPSGRIIYSNEECKRVFRYSWTYSNSFEEYPERKVYTLDGVPLNKDEFPLTKAIVKGESTHGQELMIERADGSKGIVSANAAPIRDPDGEIIAAVLTLFDITEKKKAEEEVRKARDELEQRVHMRTAQLRTLALELTQAEQRERKRLAGVLHDNLQQLLVGAKWGIQDAQAKARSKDLMKSLKRADDLLNESINASKSLVVELSPPILHEAGLVAAIKWLARWMKEIHGLTVRFDADIESELDSESINILLFQSVRELLFNVVKHSQTKRAQISISRIQNHRIEIKVSDQGKGFDAMRLNASGTETGFGLFSIRERLDLLGGEVTIDSSPDSGTRVSMLVPLPSPAKLNENVPGKIITPIQKDKVQTDVAVTHGTKIRVLVADDHKIMREGLSQLLQSLPDMEVVGEAPDGKKALAMAKKLHPDIVIMDISMPRMNGIQATQQIRVEVPGVKVIGLSMYEEEDRANEMLNAGAVDYFNKAGPSQDLIASIRTHGRLRETG